MNFYFTELIQIYVADYWFRKGYNQFSIEGEMETKFQNGRKNLLTKEMTYKVDDNNDVERTSTKDGCRIFIVN